MWSTPDPMPSPARALLAASRPDQSSSELSPTPLHRGYLSSPPGSMSSPCMIGSTSGGSSTKNASDFATHDNGATGSLAQSRDPLLLSGSDLLRSLSVKPSTSPD